MNLTKKIILYELKVENFFDKERSGFGNFNGILNKLAYFKNLDVDIIAIDDILNQYENNIDLEDIKNKFGSIKDFVNLVNVFKENSIEIAPIIDLMNIKQSFINWNNMMSLYDLNEKNANLYLTKLDTYLINKSIKKTSLYEIYNFIKYFKNILNFYLKLNISTIVLDNFEFLAFDGLKEDKKIDFINDLYKIIKRKKPNMTVIFKTANNNFNLYKKMLSPKNENIDFLYLTNLSILEQKNKQKIMKNKKISYKNIFKFIKNFNQSPKVILSLNSNLSGRFLSKWGSEKAYFNESLKTFLMFLYSGNNSIAFYYGDEVGTLRASFKKDFNFNDENYNEEKRFYQSKNISLESFFNYHCYFNKLSSYTQMPWDSKQSSNFKNNKNLFYAINYQNQNVENQLENKNSALNFVYFLNSLIFDSKYAKFFKNNHFKIKHKKGIYIIKKNIDKESLVFLLNLTNQHKKILQLHDYMILNGSYANKFYSEFPKELGPFESLILCKQKQDNK
ncbi:alpha-amylase family glycosyl hydrolase [Metamycoplasma alkalescens]|uniref:Alpha-glucosidase/trehalose-6-phosphate hydrolase n=4 Tax=Metamycoplasma alkalescens TaxID=45363 RepID=A0A318U5G4_9BACT|nr:alpha-amylase family glycosyl hydrolase [Metamycoplasma alkalescens]PYF43197.1 alpha-glucosidase/trehalose-6-phosphate hydrolase [Metamycoplasma alkalescens]